MTSAYSENHGRRDFLRTTSLMGAGGLFAGFSPSARAAASLDEAVAQAHAQLFSHHVDQHGVILDYAGDLPTPEDCALGKPNAIGWWSPIENGPMFTGLYLPAACERARRTGKAADKDEARKLAHGLIKCASISDVPGFIARGMGTDGACHYPLGSNDQTHPWFQGLHAYVMSGIPAADERLRVVAKMREVANVLESTQWRCPCDGAFKGQFRGGYQGHLFRDAVRYLYLLRAMHDVTGEAVWLERYQKALSERPVKSGKPRAEICAEGFAADLEAIPRIEEHQLWIYVGCQRSLQQLAAMEKDEAVRRHYLTGLTINAERSAAAIEGCRQFDNNDSQLFRHTHWREGYTTWYPQPTQADAEKLSKTGDKAKLGTRKAYEAKTVRNPLAAAVIVALGGDPKGRDAIERAIRHYDYSKLHMAEFFFAECAYYALPVTSL